MHKKIMILFLVLTGASTLFAPPKSMREPRARERLFHLQDRLIAKDPTKVADCIATLEERTKASMDRTERQIRDDRTGIALNSKEKALELEYINLSRSGLSHEAVMDHFLRQDLMDGGKRVETYNKFTSRELR